MKKILITGGSDGISLATARLLAAEGAQLTLVARNANKLQAAIHPPPVRPGSPLPRRQPGHARGRGPGGTAAR
jgi:3-dehydrosphinganine reductase